MKKTAFEGGLFLFKSQVLKYQVGLLGHRQINKFF